MMQNGRINCSSTGSCSSSLHRALLHRLLFKQPSPRGPVQSPLHGILFISTVDLWYVHFASCFYIDIYCIMGCYYTLYHNTYVYSLLFIRFTWRGRMSTAGMLDGKMSKYKRPNMHNSKSPETSRRLFLEYIKNIGRGKNQRGSTS